MGIEVVDLNQADIPGAIEVIQQAFADDPYFKWVFDASKVSADSKRKDHPAKLTVALARSVDRLHGSHPVQQTKEL